MRTSQEKKKDLNNKEKIDENKNKKYLLFKEIKKKLMRILFHLKME